MKGGKKIPEKMEPALLSRFTDRSCCGSRTVRFFFFGLLHVFINIMRSLPIPALIAAALCSHVSFLNHQRRGLSSKCDRKWHV
jgi:hypothetical protein